MSDETGPPQLLALLKKSQAFAESLLQENEQSNLKLAATEERLHAAEAERDGLRKRIDDVHVHSTANSKAFAAIDEELNALANLHVATWQLHSTMDLGEVLNVITEICVNLVGADEVVVYLHDESREVLIPVSERTESPAEEVSVGSGPIGKGVASGEVRISDNRPRVIVPLRLGERIFGAVVIETLLPQKEELTDLDHQLFEVLNEQGCSAVYGAYLAGLTAAPITSATVRSQLDD